MWLEEDRVQSAASEKVACCVGGGYARPMYHNTPYNGDSSDESE